MADNAKKSADDAVEQKGRAELEEKKPLTAEEAERVEETTQHTTPEAEKADASNSEELANDTSESSSNDEAADDNNSNPQLAQENHGDDKKDPEASGKGAENCKEPEESETSNAADEKSRAASNSSLLDDKFQTGIREQIENVKFEIISSIQENLHSELKDYTLKQIRKIERRRRIGVIVRDVVILLLAVVVGYFGYCLYDAQYFDFMQPFCEQSDNCEDDKNESDTKTDSEVVKDTAWYQRTYGYLFDSLQINLNADKVSAYYLYSDDYKVSDIQPSYLLAMAYNRLNSNITYDSDKGIMVPANDLKTSFVNLFGDAEYFTKQNFTYDCAEFTYDRVSDSFITPSMQCNSTSNRQIVEEIDEIYEEGNVIYFLTTAAIFDKAEGSLYTFDNLFKPVAQNVEKADFAKYKASSNRYQYRFKKVDDKYYFSDIVKLK